MPESTIAIVGVGVPAAVSPHDFATLETYGHCCVFPNPATLTGASGVIAKIPDLVARRWIALPVSRAATPLMDRKRFVATAWPGRRQGRPRSRRRRPRRWSSQAFPGR